MIQLIKERKFKIISFQEYPILRPDTYNFSVEVLKQKYLLHRGLWAVQFNDPEGAMKLFSEAL